MYLRCVELGADDLSIETEAEALDLVQRASTLGANALTTSSGTIPTMLRDAAISARLNIIGEEHNNPRQPMQPPAFSAAWTSWSVTAWPKLPAGAAGAQLARRHRLWPGALTWVSSTMPTGVRAPSEVPVPSNVIATVRRMSGRPGRGFSAPWPEHPRDPAWAPTTVLPEPPPTRLPPGRGFAVNLWLCGDPDTSLTDPRVTATVRWGDLAHSWAFTGPTPATPVAAIGTLPLIRPPGDQLALELSVSSGSEAGSKQRGQWSYQLVDDAAGVPFWSPAPPEE